MQVTIENFGPIGRVEFDLSKDLSVIFGKNNIGKSYAITATYLLLKVLREALGDTALDLYQSDFLQRWRRPEAGGPTGGSATKQAAAALRARFNANDSIREQEATVEMTELLRETLTVLENPLTDAFASSFPPLDGLSNWFQDQPFTITVHTRIAAFVLQAKGARLAVSAVKLHYPVKVRLVRTSRSAIISARGEVIVYYFEGKAYVGQQADDDGSVRDGIWSLLFQLRDDVFSTAHTIFYLPASRSGLYPTLTAIAPLIAELAKSRHLLKGAITLPRLTRPVADYFLHLSTLNASASKGQVAAVGAEMEQQLLGGEVSFNDQTKELQFTQTGSTQALDLAFTSSMISELAPVVAFLKYILPTPVPKAEDEDKIPPGPTLLFIEEPEAHLHPEVQVKLLEFFARLTKHNVKVVMTTHSNYMFNKLSNLLLTGEMTPEQVGSYLMINTPEGSVIAPEMKAETEGIADENFADVAEQLYNERLRAYDAQNNS